MNPEPKHASGNRCTPTREKTRQLYVSDLWTHQEGDSDDGGAYDNQYAGNKHLQYRGHLFRGVAQHPGDSGGGSGVSCDGNHSSSGLLLWKWFWHIHFSHIGCQDVHSARVMASTGFFSALFFGALITVLGLLFLKPLSLALGSTPTILPYTERYLGGILLGAPFLTASMTLNNQMRFQGNANQAMYGMMTGAALNVVLVPFFMFVLNMGILGTAIGTVSSQIVAFVVLLVMASREITLRFVGAT